MIIIRAIINNFLINKHIITIFMVRFRINFYLSATSKK